MLSSSNYILLDHAFYVKCRINDFTRKILASIKNLYMKKIDKQPAKMMENKIIVCYHNWIQEKIS